MYTFALVGRDLVLGEHNYTTVTGPTKIAQDLGVATLEPFGCDRFHPGWGSILNQLVGSPSSPSAVQGVTAEVSRLVTNYMATQSATTAAYAAAGLANPYQVEDLVSGIASQTASTATTTVTVSTTVSTGSGAQVTVPTTLGA